MQSISNHTTVRQRVANDRCPGMGLRQRGFSLIEVLVAFLIFALGMLGAAGLQINSLKSSRISANSTVAVSLARDYGELMQNFTKTGSIASDLTTSTFYIDNDWSNMPSGGTSASTCFGAAVNCTPTQLAESGVREWLERANAVLPKFRAKVCRDSTPVAADGTYDWTCDNTGDLVVIKLSWLIGSRQANSGETLYSDTVNAVPLVMVTVMGVSGDYRQP